MAKEKEFFDVLDEEIDKCLDKYFGDYLSYEDKFNILDEYLSCVRHDLRTPLAAAREGVNLVLDGLGNKDCSRCMDFLQSARKSVDNLNDLIEVMLGPVKFKAEAGLGDDKGGGGLNTLDKDALEGFKNEIMTKISHEVRTPLTIAKEGLALVSEEIVGKLNEDQKDLILSVKGNIDRLVKSIENILESPSDKIIKEKDG